MRKLLKWLLVAASVLAALLLIAMWGVLGVNPLEGRERQLWNLVPHDVDFFARFPGGRLLEQPAARTLERQEAFSAIADLRERIRALTEQVAREVNPQIPLGLVEIDVKRDFVDREMAIAGTIADYRSMRLRNFMALVRIPFYARFVSALRRDFVRARIAGGESIELQSGSYFRVPLDDATVKSWRSFRATMSRGDEERWLYFARKADVLVVSDNPAWIATALSGAGGLPADAFFESEFMAASRGGERVEVYVHTFLTASVVKTQARPETPLAPIREILPEKMAGYVRIAAEAEEPGLLTLEAANTPPLDGPASLRPATRKLYDAEKGDVRYELSADGIGKFVPRKRTAAAFVLHAPGTTLSELVPAFIPRALLDSIDSLVRERSNSTYVNLEQMLTAFAEDLGDTHLVILSRPAIFEGADLSAFVDPPGVWPPVPAGHLALTIVSKVKDSAVPDKVREKFTRFLPYVDVTPTGLDAKRGFHRAEAPSDSEIVLEPCFGVMPEGMRYFAFSTQVEALAAVYEAATNPAERLAADAGVKAALARLPVRATVGGYARADMMKAHLGDCVRDYAAAQLNVPLFKKQYVADEIARGRKDSDIPDAEIMARAASYTDVEYPVLRRRYLESLDWLDAFDTLSFSLTLGAGAEKKVELATFLRMAE